MINKVLEILKIIKSYFLIAVIGLLLIFIYFKNNKISKLTAQLNEKPKVEYVYQTKVDTIKINVPKPYQVVKYLPGKDTIVYKPIDLTSSDSSEIAQAYVKLSNLYGETKLYSDVVKDDSVAYIKLNEKVQFNTIQDRQVIFLGRTPTKVITETKNVYTTSIIGGIEAGTTGVEIGTGIVTKRNTVLKISYDPFNGTVRGGMYLSIFNFKNK